MHDRCWSPPKGLDERAGRQRDAGEPHHVAGARWAKEITLLLEIKQREALAVGGERRERRAKRADDIEADPIGSLHQVEHPTREPPPITMKREARLPRERATTLRLLANPGEGVTCRLDLARGHAPAPEHKDQRQEERPSDRQPPEPPPELCMRSSKSQSSERTSSG